MEQARKVGGDEGAERLREPAGAARRGRQPRHGGPAHGAALRRRPAMGPWGGPVRPHALKGERSSGECSTAGRMRPAGRRTTTPKGGGGAGARATAAAAAPRAVLALDAVCGSVRPPPRWVTRGRGLGRDPPGVGRAVCRGSLRARHGQALRLRAPRGAGCATAPCFGTRRRESPRGRGTAGEGDGTRRRRRFAAAPRRPAVALAMPAPGERPWRPGPGHTLEPGRSSGEPLRGASQPSGARVYGKTPKPNRTAGGER